MRALPLLVFPSVEGVSAAACAVFAAIVGPLSRRRRVFVVLAGGQTPRRAYEFLASAGKQSGINWERVEFFWSDERAVPPDHPQSNYRMAAETLLTPLRVHPAQIHRMRGEAADLAAAASEYEAEIARTFGVAREGAPPRFDFVFLGMGTDGHTASLFPRTAALRERDRWAVANFVPQLGSTRLTLTYPILNAARYVVFLVTGGGKAGPLRQIVAASAKLEDIPASGIRPASGKLLWIADLAAFSLTSSALPPGQI